jgi:lysophospholipase L1-like esterase
VDLKLFEQILHRARRRVESTGARFLFVYLPMWQRYGDPHMASPHREAVLDIVGKLNIPMVDMHGAFVDTGDPLSLFPFRLPAHYTPLGYRLVATEIVDAIQANQWLRN